MSVLAIPTIFNARRRAMSLRRARRRAESPDAARFIAEDMIEDTLERLAFLRHEPACAMVLGDWTGTLAGALRARGAFVEEPETLDLEAPYPASGHDLIVVIGLLDAVNDLPGALIHLRCALAPGGLVIAHFVAGQSLASLRAAMLASEPERPADEHGRHEVLGQEFGDRVLRQQLFENPGNQCSEQDERHRLPNHGDEVDHEVLNQLGVHSDLSEDTRVSCCS